VDYWGCFGQVLPMRRLLLYFLGIDESLDSWWCGVLICMYVCMYVMLEVGNYD